MSENKAWIYGIVIVTLLVVYIYPVFKDDIANMLQSSSDMIDEIINS